MKKSKTEKLKSSERPPIVVVMGHIDHGKTTLLDFIRKTKVAEKESGGITQHIGAYEAEHKGKVITFIDTPGHEAFSEMRKRGAKVADIAILVVSAEDSVKQQTKEAIATIQEAGIPFVVAINKIDKPNADPNRTKKDLAENGVLVEEYGGKVPMVEISAKLGKNVDLLLDNLLILAELEELKWNPDLPASGIVVESHTDPRRGKAATLLIADGTLRRGEFLVIKNAVTPIRVLENFKGEPIDEGTASMPVVISNLSDTAPLGEVFRVAPTKSEAEELASSSESMNLAIEQGAEETRPMLNIILKTDVAGSEEAITGILARSQFVKVGARVIKSETGEVNESDVKMAMGGRDIIIVAFHVKVPPNLRELADKSGVTIISRDIVYDLEKDIKDEMVKLVPGEIKRIDTGKARILAFFKKEKNKQIVGGKVLEGVLKRGAHFEIERNKMIIGSGKILGLQRDKHEAEEVKEGFEFGMLTDAGIGISEGDTLLIFEEEKMVPSLT